MGGLARAHPFELFELPLQALEGLIHAGPRVKRAGLGPENRSWSVDRHVDQVGDAGLMSFAVFTEFHLDSLDRRHVLGEVAHLFDGEMTQILRHLAMSAVHAYLHTLRFYNGRK